MHMLCKTRTVCLRVVDPHFIFVRICVRTIRTHIHSLLMEDLALALKQLLGLYTIHLITPLLSGDDM